MCMCVYVRKKEREKQGEKGFRPVWKSKSSREHRAVRAARTQLPGGECRGTPFYILIVEIAACMCRVYTERATSVRKMVGCQGGKERSRRIVVGKW